MLAVGVHDEPVVARAAARARSAVEPRPRTRRPGISGLAGRASRSRAARPGRGGPLGVRVVTSSLTAGATATARPASRRARSSRTGPPPTSSQGPTVPSGHWTRTSRRRRRTEPDVDPAELAAGVPATDGQLAADRRVADLDLDPGADRVPVRAGLGQAWSAEPVAHRRRRRGRLRRRRRSARAGPARRRLTSTRSSRPSRLRSASAAPRPRAKSRMPAASATWTNVPSGWPRNRSDGSLLA